MAVERYTFDTNVLFYSIDASDARKHAIARELVGLADPSSTLILLQTLGELCNSVERRKPDLLQQARELLNASTELYNVVPAIPEDLDSALTIRQRYQLQFWDAVIWMTARRAGCTLLLSEDMHDGLRLGPITARNPFSMSRAELDELLG